MKNTLKLLALIMILGLTSCGSSKDEMFYRGTITKANGERKQKVFIFGRDACVRKSKKMARRRARMNNPDRGIYGTPYGN